MASFHQCLASMTRLSLRAPARPTAAPTIPMFLMPAAATPAVRYATVNMKKKVVKKKKTYKTFRSYDLTRMDQYSLCEAMRYIRAAEVGQPPNSVKYELAVKLKTNKSGPVIKNQIRLPFPVKNDSRIGVLCADDSPLVAEALELGAVVAGGETLLEDIRNNKIPFNKFVCHADMADALNKARVARILGPKGLMPNIKNKTITKDIKSTMQDMAGAEEYRERRGVVRIAIGQLGFTPHMLSENIKTLMSALKVDISNIEDSYLKALDEVVLSSTHGPGFSLNSLLQPTDGSVKPEDLVSPM
ncbi:ribosomal protein L1-like protein [Dichotomopilus funicola]|uniref:Ribosomal protein L1-like protein n=1 Tax=Dichotomopilus funicola TaxID=1934379 RepID=A0AAN6V0Z4_9PEZI|nr:ribosomal protein L1-like protein [Dichotomopilus funicola]